MSEKPYSVKMAESFHAVLNDAQMLMTFRLLYDQDHLDITAEELRRRADRLEASVDQYAAICLKDVDSDV